MSSVGSASTPGTGGRATVVAVGSRNVLLPWVTATMPRSNGITATPHPCSAAIAALSSELSDGSAASMHWSFVMSSPKIGSAIATDSGLRPEGFGGGHAGIVTGTVGTGAVGWTTVGTGAVGTGSVGPAVGTGTVGTGAVGTGRSARRPGRDRGLGDVASRLGLSARAGDAGPEDCHDHGSTTDGNDHQSTHRLTVMQRCSSAPAGRRRQPRRQSAFANSSRNSVSVRSHASSACSALYTSGRESLKNAWWAPACTLSVASLPSSRSVAWSSPASCGV